MSIFQKRKGLRVLFVTSEQTGFAKAGGLGEVMFALPRALRKIGHDARVFMPFYGTIDKTERNNGSFKLITEGLRIVTDLKDETKHLICNVLSYTPAPRSKAENAAPTYFLENQEYYEMRSNTYGYKDDSVRFALLSRGALEFLSKKSDWIPEVIVSTDWLTGWLSNMLRVEYKDDPKLSSVASVFSIHNMGVQGMKMDHKFIPESDRDDGYGELPDLMSDRLGFINSVRRGILYADVINTVSPTHAKEIMTEEFGEGLDGLLRERRDRVFGILNGIDYRTNDPAIDQNVVRRYTPRTCGVRVENKLVLQERFGLVKDAGVFLMGIVSRLTRQKGFALLESTMDQFLKMTGSELIVLGTGATEIMEYFKELEKKYPTQVRAQLQFDDALPHAIYSGVDVVLIPSYYEPSGLTQMEAMRFGAVPVARRVGGLADTIDSYSPVDGKGTGFLFDDFEPSAFLIALTRAYTNWRHQEEWLRLTRAVMKRDFSWERSAEEYEKLFEKAIEIRTREQTAISAQ